MLKVYFSKYSLACKQKSLSFHLSSFPKYANLGRRQKIQGRKLPHTQVLNYLSVTSVFFCGYLIVKLLNWLIFDIHPVFSLEWFHHKSVRLQFLFLLVLSVLISFGKMCRNVHFCNKLSFYIYWDYKGPYLCTHRDLIVRSVQVCISCSKWQSQPPRDCILLNIHEGQDW